MSFSDHLTLALDDEEGNTMQQLLRPPDHVSDSDGTAGRAQSADVTNDSKLGERMTMATISLVGSEDSRCMGAAFRLKTAYLRGPIAMGRRMWYLSGAAFRHWIGTRSVYGQTGSIGAKAKNQPVRAAQAGPPRY